MKNLFYFMVSILLLCSSCVSKKNITYFQYDELDQTSVSNQYVTIFKPDDLLNIVISAENLEAVKPFNVLAGGIGGGVVGPGQIQPNMYLIDSQGEIDFPVLGKLKIGGLTREVAMQLFRDKLDPDYVKNPSVNIRITNFKITFLGDVPSPGTVTIPSERITIMEAIGMVGDTNLTGLRNNVLVVREENGKKNMYKVDLRSNNLFTSPVYYLQQNDVIYVEQSYGKMQTAANTRTLALITSITTFALGIILLLTR